MADEDKDLTPPRGGAKRNTRYSQVNDRELLERTADGMMQARQDLKKLSDRVDMALRPISRPWYERGAPAVMAAVLVLWFIVWTTRTSSATVPEPVAHSVAGR